MGHMKPRQYPQCVLGERFEAWVARNRHPTQIVGALTVLALAAVPAPLIRERVQTLVRSERGSHRATGRAVSVTPLVVVWGARDLLQLVEPYRDQLAAQKAAIR